MQLPRLPLMLVLALAIAVATGVSRDAEAKKPKGRFVYVHDGSGNNQIYGFRLESDGMLTPLDGSPFATGLGSTGCGGLCQTMSYSRKRRALITSGSSGLSVLFVAEDGSLSLGAGSPLLPGDVQTSFNGNEAVDKGKRTFVYVNEYGADAVRGYTLAVDGSLTELEGSPWDVGSGPDGMTVAKSKVLLCMNESDGSISSFKIGKNGELASAADSPVGFATDFSWNLHLDPKQKTVYAGDDSAGDVYAFRIDFSRGGITELPDSPFAVSSGAVGAGVSFSKSKKFPGLTMPTSGADGPVVAVKPDRKGALTVLTEEQPLFGLGSVNGHGRTRNGKVLVVASAGVVKSYAVDKSGAVTEIDSESAVGNVNDLVVVD